MGLEARGGAEPSHYALRSLDDIELLVRALEYDDLLAARDAANLRWFDARGFDELEARTPPRTTTPPGAAPAYSRHDPINGEKPSYMRTDPNPPPKYKKHDPLKKKSAKRTLGLI